MALWDRGGLDPTQTFDEFSRHYDHGAGAGERARAAWLRHRAGCDDWRSNEPASYVAAEAAACNRRIAVGLWALRVYVMLFRRTRDAHLYKRNGIEHEKALIRVWRKRLANAQVEARCEAKRPPMSKGPPVY